ncbi:hypothetical protein Y032_0049g1742 [Ancylostoma ceylanicum]|uniref:Uncharacterized protein n=1 Tax=Ancylostoma ceylanicum TaxID=53326 RepID=A0A016U9X3_9BILA|nr:hypothetical protein Y032_0049g1742 [Ancylostoma ceylanicum]
MRALDSRIWSLEHWLEGKQIRGEDDLKLELSAFFESKERCFLSAILLVVGRESSIIIVHSSDKHGTFFHTKGNPSLHQAYC